MKLLRTEFSGIFDIETCMENLLFATIHDCYHLQLMFQQNKVCIKIGINDTANYSMP